MMQKTFLSFSNYELDSNVNFPRPIENEDDHYNLLSHFSLGTGTPRLSSPVARDRPSSRINHATNGRAARRRPSTVCWRSGAIRRRNVLFSRDSRTLAPILASKSGPTAPPIRPSSVSRVSNRRTREPTGAWSTTAMAKWNTNSASTSQVSYKNRAFRKETLTARKRSKKVIF